MRRSNRKSITIIFILAGLGAAILLYSYLESRWIKTREIQLVSADVPESFQGWRVVFISDIHHGPFLSRERVSRLVKRINNREPDLILMGGDYVQRDAIYIQPFFDEIKGLKSTHGIYAVLGNHDHWEDAQLTRQLMTRNNIRICDNKSYWVHEGKDSIKIGGVGDSWEDIQILDSTIFDLSKEHFSVLIAHNPDYLEYLDSDLIDLTVSGHTHGGQITLFGLWAPILPVVHGQKYRYGLKHFGDRQSYITSGVGTITPPLRLFCRPEIVVFTLSQ